MRLAALFAVAALAASSAMAGEVEERALLQQRAAWWAASDHTLDVAGMAPLETVRGGRGPALRKADPERRTITPQALAAAIAYVRPFTTQSLLVWQGGRLQLEWYGEGAGPTSTSSPASMMKPVMALAMGAAVRDGFIKSVDDPVEAYLPEWRGERRGQVRLRQLLQMTSGLRKDPQARDGGRGQALMLGTRLEQTLLETPLAGTPGAAFDYNNTNSGLLGLILQRATGRRYADWLSWAVWRPMGAGDAAVWLDRPGGLARTYCCLVATGRDWLRLGLLIKDAGRVGRRQIVPAAWIDEMTAPSSANPNFGYQIWRASPYAAKRAYGAGGTSFVPAGEPFLAEDMVYFDGAGGQRVYISRSRDLVIVRIGSAASGWDDSRLPNLITAGIAP